MWNKIAKKFGEQRFKRTSRGILDTPPLVTRKTSLAFVSMVSHKDLLAYLLAIKSIYRFVAEGHIFIVNDGTLNEEDIRLLKFHCDNPTIVRADEIDTSPCPRGGTWERLMFIAEIAKDYYVIQIDSDLLAVAPIPEVVEAYRENTAFTQSGEAISSIVTLEQAAAYADLQPGQHMQFVSERALRSLGPAFGQRYARGCSGFAGFPGGRDLRPIARSFSARMTELVGVDIWTQWGSEQVTSNYVIANLEGAKLLEPSLYMIHWASGDSNIARLIHFVGPFRHRLGTYVKNSKRVIAELKTKGTRFG